MEQITESPQTQSQSLHGFIPLLGLTEALGALLVILVVVWTTYFRGGFSWRSNPGLEFNWHPLLMTIALVFLYANGIVYLKINISFCSYNYVCNLQACLSFLAMLIYRTQRTLRKKRLKLFHAGQMFLIIFLTVFALIAVFDSHNLASPPIPNMYSLHSWVGLTTVILFCCQVKMYYTMILNSETLIFHIYSGLPDLSLSSFLGYIFRCELLICQFTCTSALQALSVRLHRVYWDLMKRQFLL